MRRQQESARPYRWHLQAHGHRGIPCCGRLVIFNVWSVVEVLEGIQLCVADVGPGWHDRDISGSEKHLT